jgi:hypothetical protein
VLHYFSRAFNIYLWNYRGRGSWKKECQGIILEISSHVQRSSSHTIFPWACVCCILILFYPNALYVALLEPCWRKKILTSSWIMVSDCSRYRECKMQHMPEFVAWCCYCCSMPAQLLVNLLVLLASVGFSESLGSDPSFF